MLRCFVWAVSTLLAMTAPASADDDAWMQQRTRLISEARVLFAEMLKPAPSSWKPVPDTGLDKPERCTIEGEWYSYVTVPEEIAREYLGLTIHADLTISSNVASTSPAEIIDPEDKTPEIFCTKSQREQLHEEMRQAVLKKYAHLAANQDGFDQTVHARIAAYSFPVFSANYDRAIVVVMGYGIFARRVLRENGVTAIINNSGGVNAEIWDKKDGIWRQVDKKELGHFE